MASPVPKNEESTIKNSAIKVLFGLKSIGFTSIKMISNEEIKVNNYQAYQVIGQANSTNGKVHIIIQIVKSGVKEVILQGMQIEGKFDPKIFTELTDTIRFK